MDLDRTFKVFADRFASDYVRWLLGPDMALDEVLKTELPASTRHADMVYRLTDMPRQTAFIWHVEFQAQRSEEPMPLRMLEYYTRLRSQHHLPVCSMVLYPTRAAWANDDGVLVESCLSDEVLRFRYRVVRLWEVETAALMQNGLWGLYPLLGLTRLAAPVEESLRQCVELASQVSDPLLRQDLWFGFKTIAALVHPKDLLDMLIRKEMIMDSPVLQEIYQEGMERGMERGLEQGLERGEIRGRQVAILDIVTTRFALPLRTLAQLERVSALITSRAALQHLTVVAFQAVGFEEFEQALQRLGVKLE